MQQRISYHTFGCRLNQYDTEAIRTLLGNEYETAKEGEEAQIHLVNTCSVTARADATARKAIARIHRESPAAKIVVTGCYAQRAPEELAALPGVSLVVGAADRARIKALVDRLDNAPGALPNSPLIAVSPIWTAKSFLEVSITEMTEHSRAFVKVQEGCNEACTFCIVPQTRGPSRSRPFEGVIEQVRALVGSGYCEVVLTGVHLGDYGLDLPDRRRLLPDLIESILALDGIERFRLSSIEPASISDDIIELMASSPVFARHFHIPFQSGSDSVLERMKRRYKAKEFDDLIRRISERIPDCGIGTDVICGFPGESDDDFLRTFDYVQTLPITYVHAFTYSTRPGSQAEHFGDQVPGDIRKRRTRALKKLSSDKNRRFAERHLQRTLDVLIEPTRRGGMIKQSGWSDNYLKVEIENESTESSQLDSQINKDRGHSKIQSIRITSLNADGTLKGIPIDSGINSKPETPIHSKSLR
ncbi:tRNA (N(6)-L-threonylcarbamoyladenosine(37)-C(2))-methylthiotransferase MtaB [Thioalkalivibrio sp. HK1]|uniref:tRNA (N(6)-L-threonylcarbamoyladenosine(37)-C(2))- methylthiotransferase MtaB n=1 Tax=Thioalkalivibrio sp. HK1 TaxID=1469245 RepID=UPI0018CC33BA|nr:tRNA (N(6)-L-threonylcarbamoyladenosine(37)-C(2))-methylthiotransferase MtaB [Thioalkalivibrio sp. HK1]